MARKSSLEVSTLGTPSTAGGVAKVVAHMSTGSINVMQNWVAQVQSSGMTNIAMYMSQPDPNRNLNPTPNYVQQMATLMNADYNVVFNLMITTGPLLHDFNIWVRNQAHRLMTADFAIHQRDSDDVDSTKPGFGEMESSAADDVIADTYRLIAY
ncbi:hypothetical protein BPAE_0262g00010 [Botrytis paeoniae]|uniref:Uncharacterized protein n=1 Tax=Botrytis paeoniae TaxID=278948 RepID=A0A4Z1F7Q0_9HELO|nr:hypothetical protein BPAE_0262g00010 [Botrytis paeoniae]